MPLWDFTAAVNGFRKAHSSEEEAPPPMSSERAKELGIEGF